MSEDTSVFDAEASAASRDEAIARVDAATSPLWKAEALEAVQSLCVAQEMFTTDDIWFLLQQRKVSKPREHRAMGPIMLQAKKLGYCVRTKDFKQSVREESHRMDLPVWKSLLFLEEGGDMPIKLKSKSRPGKCWGEYCRKEEDLVPVEIDGRTVELCEEHYNAHLAPAVEAPVEPVAPVEPPEVAIERTAATEATEAVNTLASLQTFTIENEGDLTFVAEVLAEVKGKNNGLEAMKQSATKPFNEGLKVVRGWFAPAQNAYAQVEALLKRKIAEYHTAVEAKRLAALAKIDDAADSATITTALAELGAAEKPVTPGITVMDVWTYEIVDAALLPREYLMPDERKIRASSAAGVEILGVRRYMTQRVASRSA